MTSEAGNSHVHTVLVVDDDSTILGILRKILERDGYIVISAGSGEEALPIVASRMPCLVLSDVNMPGMDGFTLCRRLKDDPRTSAIPVAIVTGTFETDVVEKGVDAGIVDCIRKPFDQAEVRVRVRTQIQSHERLRRTELMRRQLEVELVHARKLEAVGQLAAGIAHEINTPTQFVGDSVHFLKEAFDDVMGLVGSYRSALDALASNAGDDRQLREVRDAEERADLAYLTEHVPGSFERCFDGLSRISAIVRSMKEFAHPDTREKSPTDLNKALQATLTIAKNEYKYVADVEAELGELPQVTCHVGDLNQVFLNLIVNAAHAIGEVVGDSGSRGVIRVRTSDAGDGTVRIEISDTGCGIPVAIRDHIYDPFFTTKEVGKGSGQGLAIARSIIVDKHGGSLSCQSEESKGTTFVIVIPVDGRGGKKATPVP
jgi:signal transduction histidine kinase